MRLRLSSTAIAATAAIAIASSSLAVAPATGSWARIGPEGPSLFDMVSAGTFGSVQGSKFGPDGRLYIFGSFKDAGGDPTADNIAAYDPVTDSVVGLGSDGLGDGAINSSVYDIAWVGAILYVGGAFTNAAGIAAADSLAAWNGTAWSARGATSGTVLSLASRDGSLYVGGGFTDMGGNTSADNFAVWNGRSWGALGISSFTNPVDQVLPLADGRIFAVGRFENADGIAAADRVVMWSPVTLTWQAAPGTSDGFFNNNVYAVAAVGSRVIYGGLFTNAGGIATADRLVEWTGTTWKAYDELAGDGSIHDGVVAGLAVYGSNVIASGTFTGVDGVANTAGLAVFNGTKWMAPGNSQATVVSAVDVVGRTLYASTSTKFLANGALGIAAYGLPAAPSAPRSPHATAGTKRVSLSWTAPSTANGASLRDYVIQYRRKGTTAWLTFNDGVRTTRTAVVTGLTTGRTYQFRIQAKNDWGTGSASVLVTATAR